MKLVMISSFQPYSNYTQSLCRSLAKISGLNLVVYAENDPRNKELKDCGLVKPLWSKNVKYIFQILTELSHDKPDVVHIHHEMNMYGGTLSAVLFPVLLLLIRLQVHTVVTTIHAVVPKDLIDQKFIAMFMKNGFIVNPFTLKLFFLFLYKSISVFSTKVIVHTNLLKNALVKDYFVSESKVEVIYMGVPSLRVSGVVKTSRWQNRQFLYFGYIVRRKGLENLIEGFAKFLNKTKKKDFKLVLAGGVIPGQEFARDEIANLIKKLNLEKNVSFIGFINKEQMDEYFRSSYAVVMPALITISASGPLSVGRSYGKCIIASQIGNFKEEIIDGETGLLVENNKWDEVLEKVTNNPALVHKIEKNTRQLAQERSWDNMSLTHVSIYKS